MSIGEVSFYTGILLFIIGIIGGGIDIKEVKIPEIKGVPRYMCFMGSVVFLTMGLHLKNAIPITIINTGYPTVPNAPSALVNQPIEAPRIAVNSANSIDNADADAKKNDAQTELDDANKRINVVWNATTKEIRDELLPEQRQWLKKRENDCTLESINKEPDIKMREAFKLHCMAEMTDPRTKELAQEIKDMSQ